MTKIHKLMIISITLIFIFICFLNALFKTDALSLKKDSATQVKVERIKSNYMYSNIIVDGIVDSAENQIVKINHNVIVKQIFVKENDIVSEEQQLFEFDYTDLDNSILNAENNKKSIEISIEQVEIEKQQYEDRKNISQDLKSGNLESLVLKKNNQIELYKDQIKKIDEQIDSLRKKRDEIKFYELAHRSGMICNINKELNMGGGISYSIKGTDDYIIIAQIEQKYYNLINEGQAVEINSNLVGSSVLLKGTVIKKENIITANNDESYKFGIQIKIDKDSISKSKLVLGMKVSCSISAQSSCKLPICGYRDMCSDADGKKYVYRYSESDKKLYKTYVEVNDSNDEYIQIDSGISEGDLIVTDVNDSYYDGQNISSVEVGE